ncbi:MAG TPA: 2-oxo acid dehydrogenase subunit E2 [Solirubrobacteraceae bacterium]|nr:2-oxo acid dehydrogenase subunit E2 [Solirubrobacteraceae bacterium]
MTLLEPSAAERTVARRAAESRATVPTLELSVDLRPGQAITIARLVRACGLALRAHPRANAAYREGRFELYSRVNVGIVVAQADRYLIPTVFDADTKPEAELATEIGKLLRDVAALPSTAFAGATFTVWDASPLGLATASIPVVPPQAGALTAGTRSLTLACDHRILYGAQASAFLQAIAHHVHGDGV